MECCIDEKLDYLCNSKSEISNVCKAVEGHCIQAMKIMHHHANGRFDWLISEHQSVNPSREAISIMSVKYKGFRFVHPVGIKFYTIADYSYVKCFSFALLGNRPVSEALQTGP